jgi:hypothetical protein
MSVADTLPLALTIYRIFLIMHMTVHASLNLGCSQTSFAPFVLHKRNLDAQESELHGNAASC